MRTADGRAITIRPTLPQDRELQNEFFRSLSAESRHSRFMTWLKELPDSLAEQFASIDYRSHLALLAEVFHGGRETMIGNGLKMRRENQIKKCGQDITIVNASRILHCNALTRARTAMSQFLPRSTGFFFGLFLGHEPTFGP